MIVNKGFSVSNLVGMYEIKDDSKAFGNIFSNKAIVTTYPGKLKQIYSQNSYDEGSVAYEFASINIESYESILNFCHKYGLLSTNRIMDNTTNDYIFFRKEKAIFSEVVPDDEPDQVYLNSFIRDVLTMRQILSIKSALDAKDYVTLLDNIIQILLCYRDDSEINLYSETEHFNFYFYQELRDRNNSEYIPEFDIETFNDIVKEHLLSLNDFIHMHDIPEYSDQLLEINYQDMFHCTWQNYQSLLSKLLTVTTLKINEDLNRITFSNELSMELISAAQITESEIRNAAITCISDTLNAQTTLITPDVRYEANTLTTDWNIASLLEAMYMELIVTFTPNTQIKKCANPTCNSFFDVGIGNSRKIYCSNRCAMLMAKRKQRERDKANSK
ncbi:MAG TPA: CGNR zinc finger domain-containing protein [Candidatus Merdenecus merdavium]|nr:CGNR zinc finger domain-containing protein [Candidatus Merdenecus merdavium]